MQAMEYVPTLTLDPDGAESPAAPAIPAATALEPAPVEDASAKLDIEQLNPEEQKQVRDFADKIDITSTNAVLTYGAASQRNIANFSESTLKNVRTKDMGEVGQMLSGLVVELRGFSDTGEEKRGFLGIKRKVRNKIETMKAEYAKVSSNVDRIADMLEKHQVVLLKDAAMLDKMYEVNQVYFKELTMYILAGKLKLEECTNTVLPELRKKAAETGQPEDAQAANDYANMINRFEKKLHDLELTRMVSIQMAPQIRLVQNNDTLMVEKIQTSIVNTIPLWKSQMVLALGMQNAQKAMEAQREVTNMTNELLTKNAEALKMGTIEIAKESERGVVDIETLVTTNQHLIDTLEEVRNIQSEGSQRRRTAEVELGRIEGELKTKLLELRDNPS
ncbi:MAG: toxic anion resistance protein [Oscillospiraceae bacterium]|nr:toxic anion resistance protein [Oscillospiraceae bacterium]MCL2278875.1 toxic anion resistance protein [Oscillospiraceae bacterium]